MAYRNNLGRYGQSFPPTVKPTSIPPSVGGVNAFDSLANMPPQDAIRMVNLMPTPVGLRLRQGYAEWANNIGGEVRTIIPFEGQPQDGTQDKLFAVTGEGIFDVTSNGETSPT
ncbi:MAG: hypothetical protein LC687_07285, partial [Actinobacteria bacterium]|nr:hypothetical protein [Actinomycetota bacterium]